MSTGLAPHGGCNWEGCRECFPQKTGAYYMTDAVRLAQEILTEINTYVTEAHKGNILDVLADIKERCERVVDNADTP